ALDQRLGPLGRAEQGEQDADDRGDAETAAGRGHRARLVGDDRPGLLRQERADRGDLLLDLLRIERQAPDRDHRGDRGKQGEERVEADARGDQRDVILADFVPGADQDVAPARPRNLRRTLGSPTALYLRGHALSRGIKMESGPSGPGPDQSGLLVVDPDLRCRSGPCCWSRRRRAARLPCAPCRLPPEPGRSRLATAWRPWSNRYCPSHRRGGSPRPWPPRLPPRPPAPPFRPPSRRRTWRPRSTSLAGRP